MYIILYESIRMSYELKLICLNWGIFNDGFQQLDKDITSSLRVKSIQNRLLSTQ